MTLTEIPMVLTLAGLVAYTVLGGADFGAGLWFWLGGRGPQRDRLREHTFQAMGPVWEANHVWLIFVLVVCWTAYPVAFGSIASTLAVPLFIAALGIIMRGTTYALRSGDPSPKQDRVIGWIFSASSVLTPFALGAAVGAIASQRVPVGNAQGDLFSSWLNPTSVLVGLLAVATAAYLAAVFLAVDAARQGDIRMMAAFRRRALAAGLLAGALALAGLGVLHQDAPRLLDGLGEGIGLAALLASAVSGVAALALVLRRRFEPARYAAAGAVAAIVVGWGAAQSPIFLPGLTVDQAAAGRSTLIALLVGLGIGALVLIPSLVILFRLVLVGRFDPGAELSQVRSISDPERRVSSSRLAVLLGLSAGAAVLLLVASSSWLQSLAALVLLGTIAAAYLALLAE